ncbi:MAG: ethylbenzene dehydrogenase-related protein [Gammaproteobacteria bacterium]
MIIRNKVLLALYGLLWLAAMPVSAVDWQNIPGQKITLFYPGQTDWEWLLTEHEGAPKIKSGQTCGHCHSDMQAEMGQKLVTGAVREESPFSAKPGSIEVEVKTAHDQERLYLHLAWPGIAQTGDKMYPDYEAMVSVMFDGESVPEITRGGCWGACHADVNGMPSADSSKDISKYLVKSRSKMTRHGGGDNIKPEAELQQLLASDYFSEIWQARLTRGQEPSVLSAYILEKRHDHDPSNVVAKARSENGSWAVELSRSLNIDGAGFKKLAPGNTYIFNFAVHDGYVRGRRHYVSLSYSLRLDEGPADLVARQQ